MTALQTSFEGGTAGTDVSTSSNGGDAFSGGANGSGATFTYSDAAAAVTDGAMGAHIATGATAATVWRGWTFAAATGVPVARVYLHYAAHPAARLDFFQLLTLGPTKNVARLAISATGRLQILNNSTIVASSVETIPLDTTVRVEADWVLATDGTGSCRADFYDGHSTTPLGSVEATGLTFADAVIEGFRIGAPTAGIANLSIFTDGWGVADDGARLGPLGASGPPSGTAAGSWSFVGAGAGPSLVPAGLTATAVSSSQIDLTWDEVGSAAGYDIERDGVVTVLGHAATAYSDTGLAAATQYSYRVRSVL